jgi:TolB protein
MNRILALLVMLISMVGPVNAELRVDITQGTFKPIPIAVPYFASDGSSESAKYSQMIAEIITADLVSSGLFRAIDRGAFLQGNGQYLTQPKYADWRIIQAEALVVGQVTDVGDGKITVEFRLFDILTERQVAGISLTANVADWRRVSHKIADHIYERITAEKGYFDTQILYVAESGAGKTRASRLAIMDQDGANHRYISDSKRLVLTPRFSPDMKQITFMDYGEDRRTPRVYVMDTKSKVQRRLGNFNSMTFAPRFMPDSETILMSMSSTDGDSSVYAMNLRSHVVRPLTQGAWIDTSPCASPDGRQIVFNSDRSGSQQLFLMNSDGSNQRRISYGGGMYATPVWSPRGDLIAFTKKEGNQFFIGVMRTDGTGERLLSSGYLVEEPSWSPNGRMLIFTKQSRGQRGQGNRSRLMQIDLTGHFEREIPTPNNENVTSAAWSPLLP